MFSESYERRLLQQCSPVTKRQPVLVQPEHMDRFIPCRLGNNWQTSFQAIRSGTENQPAKKARGDGTGTDGTGGGRDHLAYGCLLRNELLGAEIDELRGPPGCAEGSRAALGAVQLASAAKAALAYSPPVFRFRAPGHNSEENIDPSPYSLSPISAKSQKLLRSPRKATRKISRIPFKVLDAPELQDDFYLNLVDWSAQNVLSVGLGSCVYLWSACTSQVTRLCDLSSEGNAVTSVAWSERGHLVAVGTQKGHISVWDVSVNKEVTKLQGHIARVGALAWNGDMLSSGSRDRHIRQRDTRTPAVQSSRVLQGHRQEVCGLKWSPDGQSLASGGNDNKLFVWSMHSTSPVQTYSSHVAAVKAIAWSPHQHGLLASGGGTADRCIRFWNTLTSQPQQCVDTEHDPLSYYRQMEGLAYSPYQHSTSPVQTYSSHVAAVKAIAWSPHQHGLLASGGGTADRCIRFWNTLTSQPQQCVDTGSQVCNLAWSKHSSELVSTHGYSQNQILVWKYPSLTQVAKLTGHSYRVLYLALSPDGEAIVTGAGDETLRFWNVFSKTPSHKENKSVLNLYTALR